MKIRKFDFDHEIHLWNLGDVHRGDEACDVPALMKTVEQIRQDPLARWVSTGDLLNVGITASKTGPYHSMNVKAESDALVRELGPIGDKFLGMVKSNHHDRIDRAVGLPLDEYLFDKMGWPKHLYMGALGVVAIGVRGSTYYVCLHHGIGGGRRRGGKVNSAEEPSIIIPGADLYLSGHSHSCCSFKNKGYSINKFKFALIEYTFTVAVTGHYLQYLDCYAPDLLYRPMPIGSTVVILPVVPSGRTTEKRIKVDFFEP